MARPQKAITLSLSFAELRQLAAMLINGEATESHRTRALGLILMGAAKMNHYDVAPYCGVTPQAALKWAELFPEQGVGGYYVHRTNGDQPKLQPLTDDEIDQLINVVSLPPTIFGIEGDVWYTHDLASVMGRVLHRKVKVDNVAEALRGRDFTVEEDES